MNEYRGLWNGRRVDKNEWIVGYLIRDGCQAWIISRQDSSFMIYRVAPETLGECAGLCDKTGALIFEGDICTVAMSNIADDEYGVVKYDENEAVFIIDFDTYTINFCNNVNSSAVEIIGNIHDTPELLNATRRGHRQRRKSDRKENKL